MRGHTRDEPEQRIRDAEEVEHRRILDRQRGATRPRLRGHRVVRNLHGPEQPGRIGVDPGIEVVDLGAEVLEVKLTSVEVKSNESESAPADAAVLTHVHAAHEAHVGVEQQRLRLPGQAVCTRACALYVGEPYGAVEVRDR